MSGYQLEGRSIKRFAYDHLGSNRLDVLSPNQALALYEFAKLVTLKSEQAEDINLLIMARLIDWVTLNTNAFLILQPYMENLDIVEEDFIPEWILKYGERPELLMNMQRSRG
jgi:hypothetical protein